MKVIKWAHIQLGAINTVEYGSSTFMPRFDENSDLTHLIQIKFFAHI